MRSVRFTSTNLEAGYDKTTDERSTGPELASCCNLAMIGDPRRPAAQQRCPYGAHARQVSDGNDQAWRAFRRSQGPRGAVPAGSRPRCWRLAGALLRGGAGTGYRGRMSGEIARGP